MIKITRRKSLDILSLLPVNCKKTGMTKWLEIIVDNAIDATITIDVADENPPKKARIAKPS